MPRWRAQDGTPEYELAVKSMSIMLERANQFLRLNGHLHGLFEDQKGKKQRLKDENKRLLKNEREHMKKGRQ